MSKSLDQVSYEDIVTDLVGHSPAKDDLDRCPNDPWGRHRWYQTALASFLDEAAGSHDPQDKSRSYACEKCRQWKISPQHI